jgi:cytoskeleton protein RodZ
MQSIGERLEEARKRKGISIREAAEATKIRSDYLHKFESNQYDIKLPEIYVRGFLRTYANYLKLPAEKIINDYNGLGLGENKQQRNLNREVYGRMDLSVSSAKGEKGEETTPPTGTDAAPAVENTPRNPATFIPQGTPQGLSRDLLIKAGVLVGVTVVVVLLGVWLIFGRGDDKPAGSAPVATAGPSEIWVRPQGGESSLTLVSVGAVRVTVTAADTGSVLYQGTIPPNETRDVPYRTKLRVVTEPPENLRVRIGRSEFEMKDKGVFLRTAEINAPAR